MNPKLEKALNKLKEGREAESELNKRHEECERMRVYCLKALEDLRETVQDIIGILDDSPELYYKRCATKCGEPGYSIGTEYINCCRFVYYPGLKIIDKVSDEREPMRAVLGFDDSEIPDERTKVTIGSIYCATRKIKNANYTIDEWTKAMQLADRTNKAILVMLNAMERAADNYCINQQTKLQTGEKFSQREYMKVGTRKDQNGTKQT